MELREYVVALRKRWYLIAALGLLGALAAGMYAQSLAPQYRATSKMFVSLTAGQTAGELLQGSTFVQNSVESFVQLARMPVVLEPVVDELDLDTNAYRLAGAVSASNPINTVIIEVAVVDAEPERAADIANAVAESLGEAVQELGPRGPDGRSTISLSTVSEAIPPSWPVSPNKRLITAGGLGAGLALGVLLALSLALLDTRVRDAADLERLSRYSVLAQIVGSRRSGGAHATVTEAPMSSRAESFRRLRANLQYLDAGRPIRSLVVSSALPGEGKSSTALNLALSVADAGSSVLVIDADLRRPTLATLTGLDGSVGLTTVLVGDAALEDVVQKWGAGRLSVLPSGGIPPNPNQLLDSGAMRKLLAEATAAYDLVILDTPPLLPVVDAAILGRVTDGTLVVVALRRTRRAQVRAALEAVEAVGGNVLGLVLNGKRPGEAVGYGSRTPQAPAGWRQRLKRSAR